MLENVIDIDNLTELFKENIFEFLEILDENANDINSKILEQKYIRGNLTNIIKLLKNESSKNNKTLLTKTNNTIKLVNSNINSLYLLEIDLNKLIEQITSISISSTSDKPSKTSANTIKNYINKYSTKFSDYNNNFNKNENKISLFIQENNELYSKVKSSSKNIINISKSPNNKITTNSNTYINCNDNLNLVVSEKDNKVYLPYKASEINKYLEKYPTKYVDAKDVIEKEFTFSLEYYTKNPVIARFREIYSLIRDREGKSVFEALKYAFDFMFKRNLNPAIIAACKTEDQLEDYLTCLEHQNLNEFKHFNIEFNVNPLSV